MIGKRLGQYEILEEIGHGGMGVVYRARQASLNRDVAVKVLPDERLADPDALARFRREAMVVARITHPSLVNVIDIGEAQGTHFIAMEYLPGMTLAQRLRRKGPMSYADAVRVAVQVAGALGAIHAKGLVHRDVKPSNVIVDDQLHAKLTDFGVALLAERSDALGVTLGAAVGTPHYMSPEQVTARGEVGAASDVYALGVVLYEMLAGRHPWDGATPGEVMVKQVHEDLPPIRRYCGDIPDELEPILRRCLDKDPSARYADGTALEKVLAHALVVIEARDLAAGPVSAEYVPRVTVTGMRVIAAPDRRLPPAPAGFLPLRELWARFADPNRRLRRRVRKLSVRAQAARDLYKKIEGEAEDLKRRELYHDDHARLGREQAQKAIAAGDERGAAEAADKERHHVRMALDCRQSAKDVGRRAEEKRAAYDALRDELNRQADELALLDGEARRAGKPIPSERAGASLGFRIVLGILIGVVVFMVCMTLFGLGQGLMMVLAFKRIGLRPMPEPTHPRPAEVAAATPRTYPDGLVLHYTFDENERGVVSDKTGSGHSGRVFGARWVPDGVRGGAVDFSGGYDYIEAPDFDFPQRDGARSICWCFRLEELYRGGPTWLLSYGTMGYAEGLLLGIDWETETAAVCTREAGRKMISNAHVAETGVWFHVVYTYGGNRTHRLYVNGEESSGQTALWGRLKTKLSGEFIIGAHPADVVPGSLPGIRCRMDEIRVYNRALSAAEVRTQYLDLMAPSAPAGAS